MSSALKTIPLSEDAAKLLEELLSFVKQNPDWTNKLQKMDEYEPSAISERLIKLLGEVYPSVTGERMKTLVRCMKPV